MVPARSLHLVRNDAAAHGTAAAAIRCYDDVVTAPPPPDSRYMAQEPINHQHWEPPKPPPQPPQQHQQERIQDDHRSEAPTPTQRRRLQLQLGGGVQQEAGTSGSSSGGTSSNGVGGGGNGAGDWLRLGLGPAGTAAAPESPGSDLDLYPSSDNRAAATALARHHQNMLVLPGMPPSAFLRPAMPGIPQASIPPHMPRAGPPWLPPWSPGSAGSPAHVIQTPPPLLPFAHRAFYAAPTAANAAAFGFDTIRVVLPPSAVAAAAGVWFVLQASRHQGREPFLPQIPRSYLRIKDGRVTVRLLTKYLVNKLGLEDESEVEITCRGRQLLPILTLQHVRDSIWCQRDAVSPSVVPDISTADHIMVLQYGRRP